MIYIYTIYVFVFNGPFLCQLIGFITNVLKGGRTQNVSYIVKGVFEGGLEIPWKCKLTFWRYFEDPPHKNDTWGTFSNQFSM